MVRPIEHSDIQKLLTPTISHGTVGKQGVAKAGIILKNLAHNLKVKFLRIITALQTGVWVNNSTTMRKFTVDSIRLMNGLKGKNLNSNDLRPITTEVTAMRVSYAMLLHSGANKEGLNKIDGLLSKIETSLENKKQHLNPQKLHSKEVSSKAKEDPKEAPTEDTHAGKQAHPETEDLTKEAPTEDTHAGKQAHPETEDLTKEAPTEDTHAGKQAHPETEDLTKEEPTEGAPAGTQVPSKAEEPIKEELPLQVPSGEKQAPLRKEIEDKKDEKHLLTATSLVKTPGNLKSKGGALKKEPILKIDSKGRVLIPGARSVFRQALKQPTSGEKQVPLRKKIEDKKEKAPLEKHLLTASSTVESSKEEKKPINPKNLKPTYPLPSFDSVLFQSDDPTIEKPANDPLNKILKTRRSETESELKTVAQISRKTKANLSRNKEINNETRGLTIDLNKLGDQLKTEGFEQLGEMVKEKLTKISILTDLELWKKPILKKLNTNQVEATKIARKILIDINKEFIESGAAEFNHEGSHKVKFRHDLRDLQAPYDTVWKRLEAIYKTWE